MPTKTEAKSPAPVSPVSEPFSLIPNAKLLQLYATMLKCRMLQERASGVFKGAIPGGHEASAAGVTVDLLSKDLIVHSPSDILPSFAKGVPLARLLANFDSSKDHEAVSSLLQRAIAIAQTRKGKKNSNIIALFLTADSTTLLSCKPALLLAGALSMPILFVCQSPFPADDLASQINPYGFPGIAVDRNDVVAVYRVASESITHARKGNGPTFIECKTFNVPIANGRPAQPKSPLPPAGDSIRNMENYLTRKGLFTPQYKQTVLAEFSAKLDAAFSAATSLGNA